MPAASFSYIGDSVAHNTVSAFAADRLLLLPAVAAYTPSGAPTIPVSPALVLTGSHSVP